MENNKKEKKEFNFKPYIGIAIVMFTIVVLAYIINFHNIPISKDSGDWGTFGDFIGGTLNPTLAFLSFLALLQTIKIQSRELRNSTKELKETRKATRDSAKALEEQSNSIKIQNFENTFFNMINLHNEITKNINFDKSLIYDYDNKNLNKLYLYKSGNNQISNGKEAIKIISNIIDTFVNKTLYPRIFNCIYDLSHESIQSYLGHYFGNIYQILKFISINKDIEDKRKYSDLFRAQFSSDELKLLFYHCTGEIGSKKFKNFIEEFEFFEHLVLEKKNKNFKFILSSKIYENSAFGENQEIKEFIKVEILHNEKWIKSYFEQKDEEKDINTYIKAVIMFYQKNDFTSAFDILNKLIEKEDKNYIHAFIEDLTKLQNRHQLNNKS